jgi:hypothetical protein
VALSAKSDFTCTSPIVIFSIFAIKLIYSLCLGELAPLLIWAAVEDGLAITAASIPALKPLLTMIFPNTSSDNYNMIPYPHPLPNRKVFDNSKGETQTDIGHTTVHDMGSQTAILETIAPKGENINMITEVSVTYNHGS